MRTAIELTITSPFTGYKQEMGNVDGFLRSQYFCSECNQMFSAAWGRAFPMNSWIPRGSHAICPHCGYRHDRSVAVQRTTTMPVRIKMTVRELVDKVLLECRYESIKFIDLYRTEWQKGIEVFEFDMKSRRSCFRSKFGTTERKFSIGNPFDEGLLDQSLLRYLNKDCLFVKRNRPEITKVLKTVRDLVKSKLEKKLGRKVPSMTFTAGEGNDLLLYPLKYLAYRTTWPDAVYMPSFRSGSHSNLGNWVGERMLDEMPAGWFEKAEALAVSGMSQAESILTACDCVNASWSRKVVTESILEIGRVFAVSRITKNNDVAYRVYRSRVSTLDLSKPPVVEYLRSIRTKYGETGIARIIEREIHLTDCARIWTLLSREGREKILTQRVRSRELHDALVAVHREEKGIAFPLEVPEHIINRLSMQTDRLAFYLPQSSVDLLKAGESLHNCVGSYGAAMRNNELWVVLVADDAGKLVGCLEIKNNEIVQAKVNGNRPLNANPELNKSVIQFAESRGLRIATKDILGEERVAV